MVLRPPVEVSCRSIPLESVVFCLCQVKKPGMGAGVLSHGLGKPIALSEDSGLIHSTHTTICNPSSRGSDGFFWPPRVPGTHLVYRKVCRQNIHAHKTKFKNQKESQIWQHASTFPVLGAEAGGTGGSRWRFSVKTTVHDIKEWG